MYVAIKHAIYQKFGTPVETLLLREHDSSTVCNNKIIIVDILHRIVLNFLQQVKKDLPLEIFRLYLDYIRKNS